MEFRMSYALHVHEYPLPRSGRRSEPSDRAGIDVSGTLLGLRDELAGAATQPRRLEILAILHRWSWDRLLSGRSRREAQRMLLAFRDSARSARSH